MLPRERAQCRAHADFPDAFRNAAGDDAVDARRGERQRDDPEDLEQRQREATIRRRPREQLVHRRHAQDGLILVNRPDRLFDRRRKTSRVGVAADDE